jgi:uncharacterized protein YndB with AHSA1/START domain
VFAPSSIASGRRASCVCTWHVESGPLSLERVTVRFEPIDGATEVSVLHEGTPDAATFEGHEQGWYGCLDGLAEYVKGEPQAAS